MKRILAGILTLLTIAAIAWWQPGTVRPSSKLDTPSQCVQQMFDAARRGAVEEYLDCFAGQERQSMEREFSGATAKSRADALQRSVADLKGWALVDPPTNPGSSCVVTIEWVYAGRVDQQRLELERKGNEWRIVRANDVRPGQPAVPYGTHVSGFR